MAFIRAFVDSSSVRESSVQACIAPGSRTSLTMDRSVRRRASSASSSTAITRLAAMKNS